MISRRGQFKPAIFTTVFLLFICLAQDCPAREQTDFKPLFPVGFDHEFPKPIETFEEIKKMILDNYYSEEIRWNLSSAFAMMWL
ncbi:MAG: hypothetical protein JRI43_08950 [Deltaproteobacteria bacterium]|nr:hypothetical protein [Deltaproteobacteria bacterium]